MTRHAKDECVVVQWVFKNVSARFASSYHPPQHINFAAEVSLPIPRNPIAKEFARKKWEVMLELDPGNRTNNDGMLAVQTERCLCYRGLTTTGIEIRSVCMNRSDLSVLLFKFNTTNDQSIGQWLNYIRSTVIVLLDCCYCLLQSIMYYCTLCLMINVVCLMCTIRSDQLCLTIAT